MEKPQRQGPAPIYVDEEIDEDIEVPSNSKRDTIVSVGTHCQLLTTPITATISTQTELMSRHRTKDGDDPMKEVLKHVRGSLGHFHLTKAELLDLLGGTNNTETVKPDAEPAVELIDLSGESDKSDDNPNEEPAGEHDVELGEDEAEC